MGCDGFSWALGLMNRNLELRGQSREGAFGRDRSSELSILYVKYKNEVGCLLARPEVQLRLPANQKMQQARALFRWSKGDRCYPKTSILVSFLLW